MGTFLTETPSVNDNFVAFMMSPEFTNDVIQDRAAVDFVSGMLSGESPDGNYSPLLHMVSGALEVSSTEKMLDDNADAIKAAIESMGDGYNGPAIQQLDTEHLLALRDIYLSTNDLVTGGDDSPFEKIAITIRQDVVAAMDANDGRLPDDYIDQLKESISAQEGIFEDIDVDKAIFIADCVAERRPLLEGYNSAGLLNEDVDKMCQHYGFEVKSKEDILAEKGIQVTNDESKNVASEDASSDSVDVKDSDAAPANSHEMKGDTEIRPAEPVLVDKPSEAESDKYADLKAQISEILRSGVDAEIFSEKDLHDFNTDKRIETTVVRGDGQHATLSVAYLQAVVEGKEPVSNIVEENDWDKTSVTICIPVLDNVIRSLEQAIESGAFDKDEVVTSESLQNAPASLIDLYAGKTVGEVLESMQESKEMLIHMLDPIDADENDITKENPSAEKASADPKMIHKDAVAKYEKNMQKYGMRDMSTAIARFEMDLAARAIGEKIGAGRIMCDVFGIIQSNIIETAIIHIISAVFEGVDKLFTDRENMVTAVAKEAQLKADIREYAATTDTNRKEELAQKIFQIKPENFLDALVSTVREDAIDVSNKEEVKPFSELLKYSSVDSDSLKEFKDKYESSIKISKDSGELAVANDTEQKLDIIVSVEKGLEYLDPNADVEKEKPDFVDDKSDKKVVLEDEDKDKTDKSEEKDDEKEKEVVEKEDDRADNDGRDAVEQAPEEAADMSDDVAAAEDAVADTENVTGEENGPVKDVSPEQAALGTDYDDNLQDADETEKDRISEPIDEGLEDEFGEEWVPIDEFEIDDSPDISGEKADASNDVEALKEKIIDTLADLSSQGVEDDAIVHEINDIILGANDNGLSISDSIEALTDAKEFFEVESNGLDLQSEGIIDACLEEYGERIHTETLEGVDNPPDISSELNVPDGADVDIESVDFNMDFIDDILDDVAPDVEVEKPVGDNDTAAEKADLEFTPDDIDGGAANEGAMESADIEGGAEAVEVLI